MYLHVNAWDIELIDYDKQGERGTTTTLRRLSWLQDACIACADDYQWLSCVLAV